MGDNHGLATLLAEAQRRLETKDYAKPSTNLNTEPLVRLLWALGRTGDRRVVPVLGAFSTDAAQLSFQRFRAIAVSLGQLRDPAAAPVLATMVKSRNESADAAELIAACALFRCGDADGLARRALERFCVRSQRPLFSPRLASASIVIPGRALNCRTQTIWAMWTGSMTQAGRKSRNTGGCWHAWPVRAVCEDCCSIRLQFEADINSTNSTAPGPNSTSTTAG